MVKIGHNEQMRTKATKLGHIAEVGYNPPVSHELDLEILPISELRRKASPEHLGAPQMIKFYLLMHITEGCCTHSVDFESIKCTAGSLLLLRPGQVQAYDITADWHGWMVIFRAEFLQPSQATTLVTEADLVQRLETMPVRFQLKAAEKTAVGEGILRMFQDLKFMASASMLHPLLRNQLLALLMRLSIVETRLEQREQAPPASLLRFKRFRLTLEQHFREHHKVGHYAHLLGCSEKSLSRVCLGVSGVSAKSLLLQRIALEAKRLLVHTSLPISTIADKLGFGDATNFVKFFRREVGCPPGMFRIKQA